MSHKIRLDNLLTRKCFPHVFSEPTEMSDASNSNNEDHAPSQKSIDDPVLLSMVKDIDDYMYSFKPKTCSTCNNKWYVSALEPPGNVNLDILNPTKNKCFSVR